MAALEAALARAREGGGGVVGVVGEAGIGKSRLCHEFLERCRGRGLATYEAYGVAHGKAIPFLPLLQLLRNVFGITEADSAAAAREKIAGRLLLLDRTLDETLPVVFDFLAVPDPERPAPALDAGVRQHQLFELIRRVIKIRRETTVTLLDGCINRTSISPAPSWQRRSAMRRDVSASSARRSACSRRWAPRSAPRRWHGSLPHELPARVASEVRRVSGASPDVRAEQLMDERLIADSRARWTQGDARSGWRKRERRTPSRALGRPAGLG
jgi:hypothetical protein